jgi:hypothetical protein
VHHSRILRAIQPRPFACTTRERVLRLAAAVRSAAPLARHWRFGAVHP